MVVEVYRLGKRSFRKKLEAGRFLNPPFLFCGGFPLIPNDLIYYTHLSKNIIEDGAILPLERIRKLLEWFIEFFKSKDYAYGCPIGNLAQEMGDLSPAFREKLRTALDSIVDIYARLLAEAQWEGRICNSLEVREAARFLVSSWHGALVHMKAVKGSEPLENHIKFIFDRVLRA